jgi:PhzF family phenazine biosynthesis protein
LKRFRFKKIDAFTGARSPGNPAGCVLLDGMGDITDGEMLAIARELKGFVSEVAYVFPEGDGFFLRYFSSEREVEFCGHATIAAMFDAFHFGALQGRAETAIRVGNSRLTVQNGQEGVFIAAPEPNFHRMGIHVDEVLRPLGINGADLDGRFGVSLVRCGLLALLVPLRRAGILTDVSPDIEDLAGFCEKHGVDIVVLFTDDRILPGSHYRTRVFAPKFGYLEDPATGSGNAALGCWLIKEGHWDGSTLTIEQGKSYRAPNIVTLKSSKEGGRVAVWFGGCATVRIDGWYQLQQEG